MSRSLTSVIRSARSNFELISRRFCQVVACHPHETVKAPANAGVHGFVTGTQKPAIRTRRLGMGSRPPMAGTGSCSRPPPVGHSLRAVRDADRPTRFEPLGAHLFKHRRVNPWSVGLKADRMRKSRSPLWCVRYAVVQLPGRAKDRGRKPKPPLPSRSSSSGLV